ncbi:MAG TPA: acetate--CoA ligase family protein [Candidatus Limnocylindria bacterium]
MTTVFEARRANGRSDPARLRRFMDPRSIAIVGARDNPGTAALVTKMADAGIELFLVNPNRPELFGAKTYPKLEAIGAPVDAVLAMVNAEVSVAVAAEAAAIDAGGVVVGAAGFGEAGKAGAALQERLSTVAAKAGMPVLGPNCLGFINATSGAWVSMTPSFPLRRGSIGVISHSGALLRPSMSAAEQRRIGFSFLISAGNEAVTDMADYVEFLADDPSTRVICLIVEMVRRPQALLAAVDRAVAGGKAVLALRLARGERARAVARSHTGSLVGDGRAYDVAFRQHSIVLAHDLDDLFDRASLLDQIPTERWTAVRGLGVITASGGGAGLISDLSEAENVPLPAPPELAASLGPIIPGLTIPNPLDMTGFAVGNPESVDAIFRAFDAAPEFDTDLVVWGLSAHDEAFGKTMIDGLLKHAASSDRLHLLSAVDGSQPAAWTERVRTAGVGVGHGLRGTLRGLATMRAVARGRERSATLPILHTQPIARPSAKAVQVPEGAMLPFATAMSLLRGSGIPAAPFRVLDGSAVPDPSTLPFPAPYVVKLADVAHRSEVGAVRLNVTEATLADAVQELQALAARSGLAPAIVVQPQLKSSGEAFLGIQSTELGPLVLFGIGGTMVELIRRISMRIAPFGPREAAELIDELDAPQLFTGFRGQRPWDRGELEKILIATSRLAAGSTAWLGSLDVNPLVLTADGFVAVDCLCLLRDDAPAGRA